MVGWPMRLALWDEQGIGDRLLAANLLRNLKDLEIEVVLECHPRLESIYRRSFPWIPYIYPTSKDERIDWPITVKPDAKCAVMSLSKFFWTSGQFDRSPYIVVNDELRHAYRQEFERLGDPPYFTFSWMGGAVKTNTKYRSLKLGWFRDLIESGGTWISMQYHEEAPAKVERFRKDTGLPVFHCRAAQEKNYDHTLAALAAADHTITACNSIVHTCGAAGLSGWVLVPKRRAWRYPSGPFFPWYGDHVRMFHQHVDLEWEGVLSEVKEALNADRDCWTRAIAAES